MTRPAPERRTVANVAELLATMPPAAASDAMNKILDAIVDGLCRDGWPEREAEMFSIRFGRNVGELLREMARPDDATLH